MNGTSIDQRAPVLALHCSLGSSAQWRSLAKLMPEREVIGLDLLGYGNAPFPARGDDFTLDDEVDAIERELDQRLGARAPLHVVGHSYGGAVAWRLVLRDPSRVKSITLFEPVTLWLIKQRPEAELLRTLARSAAREVENGLTMQAAQRFIDFWSGAGAFSSLPVERQSALAGTHEQGQAGLHRLPRRTCGLARAWLPEHARIAAEWPRHAGCDESEHADSAICIHRLQDRRGGRRAHGSGGESSTSRLGYCEFHRVA